MNILISQKSFERVAERKSYTGAVKTGSCRIKEGMSNKELVNMLRSENQELVMVIFSNLRVFGHLAGKVSGYIEPDS